MKKILSLILFATMMVGNSFAQSHLVATLDHEGTVSVFTGADAFIKANDVADDGDIITLSSGEFQAGTKITKAISLYGAGTIPYDSSTRFSDSLAIELSNSNRMFIEGITFSTIYTYGLSNATFSKCKIYGTYLRPIIGQSCNVDFIHCLFGYLSNTAGIATLINCFVQGLRNEENDSTGYICNNCDIGFDYQYATGYDTRAYIFRSVFTNCVFWMNKGLLENANNSMFSCLITGPSYYNGHSNDIYNNCAGITIERSSLSFDSSPSGVFVDYPNAFDYDYDVNRFQLTNEAKAKYLGNDGTEVGIFGGAMPYNPNPSVPKIKNFRMDAKPSEGILKANVEVE